MKAELTFVFAAVLLLAGADALAQHVPQAERHRISEQGGTVNQAPQPTGWWEKTWGAIAPSPVGGVVGTALGASSKEEAERLALENCKSQGGGACRVSLTYHNQCGVMVIGDKEFFTAHAGSEKEANEEGLEFCKENDTNCEVYYTACTKPIFHKY